MEAQQKVMREIDCSIEMESAEIERKLRDGEPLLEKGSIEVDPGKLRGLVSVIADVIDAETKDGFSGSGKILNWSGLDPENIGDTEERVVSGGTLEADGWTEEENRLASNILWEAFSPFYRKYGSIFESNLDHSLWQRGYCPVCGCGPLMGKFRSEDGLWLLECNLCHTMWNVKRASCPFCDGGPEGSLKYLYLDGKNNCRVQYCECCRFYVKTINLRDSERESLLPLEDITTMELDQAALEEGLKPASGYSRFNG